MTPEDPSLNASGSLATDPGTSPLQGRICAAPPRAAKLVPKPVLPPRAQAPLPAASSFSKPVRLPERGGRSNLERKLAGLHDAGEMLQTLETELVLQRAKRLNGAGSRQGLRVAAIALFFTLLIAAMGAMFYLQSQLAGKGFSRHRSDAPAVTANPAPGASGPGAGPALPPAGGRR